MTKIEPVFLLCLFYFSGGNLSAQQSWIQRTPFKSPGRLQTVGFSIGDKGYVATGTNGTTLQYMQDLQEYDPKTDTWTSRSDVPVPLRGGSVFVIGSKAYITTGASPSGLINTLYEWNQATNTWTTRAPLPAGGARMAAIGFGLRNRGYIATGFDGAMRQLNDLWEYDPMDNVWKRKASLPGSGRSYATGFIVGEKFYLGTGESGGGCLKDFWEYDPYIDLWTRLPDIPGSARSGAIGFSANGKGYVAGGVDLSFQPLADVWEYNPLSKTWAQVDPFPGTPRAYGVSFSVDESGYLAGGTTVYGDVSELWESFPGKMTIRLTAEDPLGRPVIISPNPFFYIFALKMRHPYTGMLELTISNLQGNVVFRKNFNKDEYYIVRTYEIDYLPDGLFIFTVKDPTGSLNFKQTVIHKSFGI